MTLDLRVTVVGPGRVGGSLAAALAGAGEAVELRGRPGAPPPALEAAPGVIGAAGPPAPGEPVAPTLVLAVPDDELEATASAWAAALDGGEDAGGSAAGDPDVPAPVALHTSGAHGPEALAPLRAAGRAVGGWHPLTAVAAVDPGAFRGRAAGVSGDPGAVERARALSEAVGARPIPVDDGAHARYHAAAVLASNGLVACLAAAREELAGATGGRGDLEDLLPLARAALEHVEALGLDGGLTGPVDRGDAGTVRRDLEALGPERAGLYRRLARELLDLAGDRLPPGRRRALRELLEG